MNIAKINEVNTVNSHWVKLYDAEKNACTIYSYDTPVLRIDETGAHRLWSGWSATTQKDINKAGFPFVFGYDMTKKIWDSMPIEN